MASCSDEASLSVRLEGYAHDMECSLDNDVEGLHGVEDNGDTLVLSGYSGDGYGLSDSGRFLDDLFDKRHEHENLASITNEEETKQENFNEAQSDAAALPLSDIPFQMEDAGGYGIITSDEEQLNAFKKENFPVPYMISNNESSKDFVEDAMRGKPREKEESSESITEMNKSRKRSKGKKKRPQTIIDMLPVQKKPQKGAVSLVWNTDFQTALSMNEEPPKWEMLAKTARDFIYCSKTYGKIIISEYLLPDDEKTIRPLSDKGEHGIAGGRKYITNGIFFKFALDTLIEPTADEKGYSKPSFYMYGTATTPNDVAAMKSARNDMIGLLSYYNSDVPGLHYPLMAIIDYRGFRLIALSIIPIEGDNTLEYGSRDAGRHLYCNPGIAEKMREVALRLNLKGHEVRGHRHCLIYGPADIEAHRGKDGRYYVLDFARVFPPETPSKKARETHPRETYYKLLRPEFVRTNPVPLNSDAYSGFDLPGERNEELFNATLLLITTTIPQFTHQQMPKITPENYTTFRLTEQLHRSGLNCRHLGRVRDNLATTNISETHRTFLQQYLLSEMLARLLTTILRNLLREEMRRARIAAREDPYVELAFSFLNIILETPIPDPPAGPAKLDTPVDTDKQEFEIPNSLKEFRKQGYWCWEMKFLIQQKFKKALSLTELEECSDLRNLVIMPWVIKRLCTQSGIKINKHAMLEYETSPRGFQLIKFDVQKLTARVRHLNVIDEALANLLFNEAKQRHIVRPGLWNAINEKFQRAVASNTTNPRTFIRWGDMLMTQCSMLPFQKKERFMEQSLALLNSAYEKFSDAEDSVAIHHALWEIPYNKAQIQATRAVVLLLYATTDAIALRQWYFCDATSEFQRAFSMKPHSFTKLVAYVQDIFQKATESLTIFDEQKQKKKEFQMLKAFYLLRTALQVAPVLPDCTIFHQAGVILYQYLREVRGATDAPVAILRNSGFQLRQSLSFSSDMAEASKVRQNNSQAGKDISYEATSCSLAAEAASMFESAFLLTGSASDADFTYTFPECRYKPLHPHTAHTTFPMEVLSKEDYESVEQVNVLPLFSQIYLVPFVVRNPKNDYKKSQCVNKLYNLLTKGDIYRDKHWDIPQKLFVLHHPFYHPVIVSQFSVRCTTLHKIQIHLVGSTFPHHNINKDVIHVLASREAPPSSPGPGSKPNEERFDRDLEDAFLLGSFEVANNEVRTFPVVANTNSCRYITVFIDCKVAVESYRFHGFQIYGFQVPSEEESAATQTIRDYHRLSRTRKVSWAKDRECPLKMSVDAMDSQRITLRNTMKPLSSLRRASHQSLPFSIRASPAFALEYEEVNKKGKKQRRANQVNKPSQRTKVSPVLYYVSQGNPKADASMIASAIESYKSEAKKSVELTIIRISSLLELEAHLNTEDERMTSRRIKKGLLRVVAANLHRGAQNSEETVTKLVHTLQAHPLWRKTLLLIYYHDGFVSALRDEERYVWTATDSRQVLDFMAMKWTSPGLNFDPFGVFQRLRELPTTHSLTSTVLSSVSSIAIPLARRMRSQSFSSETPPPSPSPVAPQVEEEDLPLAPFVYFEIHIPINWDGNYELAIGVSPAQFNTNTLPGFSLGSCAWHGVKGALYSGQANKAYPFEDGSKHCFAPGDVVGCGYDIVAQQLYWTKNGTYIGSAQGGGSSVNRTHAKYMFPTVGIGSSAVTLDVEGNFGDKEFLFDWRNLEENKNLLPVDASEEELSMRSSQSIMRINPYADSLFSSCENNQRHDLMILSELSKFSFALQCLFRAHLINRTMVQKEKHLTRYRSLIFSYCSQLRENTLAQTFQLFPAVSNLNLSNLSLERSFMARMPPSVCHIRVLNLEGIDSLDISTARCLVDRCPDLEAIRLWNTITDESLFVLGGLTKLTNIELIQCNRITDNGVIGLLKTRKGLLSLQFEKCLKITEAIYNVIRKSSFCSSLLKLRIDNCHLFTSESKLISLLKKMTSLIAFSFAGNASYRPPVSDDTIKTLCRLSGSNLRALNIYRCEISDLAFEQIADCCYNLEELNIGHLRVADCTLASFAKKFHSLRRLELVCTSIRDGTLLLFAYNHHELKQLSVQRCGHLTTVGIKEVIPYFKNLTFLSLKEITVDEELINTMALQDVLPRLKRLDLRRMISKDVEYSLVLLKAEKPSWIIYERSNAVAASFEGKSISTLTFPPEKINSVRLRKNSL